MVCGVWFCGYTAAAAVMSCAWKREATTRGHLRRILFRFCLSGTGWEENGRPGMKIQDMFFGNLAAFAGTLNDG